MGPGIREGVNRANLQANNPENEVEDGWQEFWLEHFNLEKERWHLGLRYHRSLLGGPSAEVLPTFCVLQRLEGPGIQ